MPQLTVNYSQALAELISAGEIHFEGIEVGPWFSTQRIQDLQKEYPQLPFQFHASSFISRYTLLPGKLKELQNYHACTRSRWVSLHIELLPLLHFNAGSRLGLHLPPPQSAKRKKRFLRLLAEIKNAFEIPIILENLPSLPQKEYAFAASPELITEILEESGCGLLLDLAHARVAASHQGMDPKTHLQNLPLEKVKQVHVSGPRIKNGFLYDAHEPMQTEDYALLEWTLEHSHPEVVTLEYFREKQALRKQLTSLQQIITG